MKIHFIFDKTKKSIFLKKKLLKKYKNYSKSKSDVFVVGGGDGFMLNSIKKNFKYSKPFFGINCGSYGFLMNKYTTINLNKSLSRAKKIIINPLEAIIKKKKFLAINEISFFRQSRQTASIKIYLNNRVLLNKLVADGVLISTPAGSTAYNLSANGPIISLKSEKIVITPINPFRPRRYKSRIVSDKAKIKIVNLDPKKRPISVVADNKEIRNINYVNVKLNKQIKFYLLFDPKTNLNKKIQKEKTIISSS